VTHLTTERRTVKCNLKGAILGLLACALFLNACAAGWSHTSDAALERIFRAHAAEFEALLADVQADPQLTTVQRGSLVYKGRLMNLHASDPAEIERAGLPKERWMSYQKQLGDLGLYGVMKGNRTVEFRVDPGSLYNGDSYKGYEYISTPPQHVRASLDGYRTSDEDKNEYGNWVVYKPLKDDAAGVLGIFHGHGWFSSNGNAPVPSLERK